VLAGASATSATPICSGVVIGGDNETSIVLTAAHCGSAKRDIDKRLFARAACDSRRTLAASSVERHPLFRQGDAASGYDFAVLTVPRVGCAPRVELSTELPASGAKLQVLVDINWSTLVLTGATPLRLKLGRSGTGVCGGSSGAPVFAEQQGRLQLVAIVASGRDDCRGDVIAGRIDAVPPTLGASRRPSDSFGGSAARTCTQCQEQQALGTGSCGNAGSHCTYDGVCTQALACLQACHTPACERQCLAAAAASPALSAMLRCTCATCVDACSAICAP
jgi:hypothetical protein